MYVRCCKKIRDEEDRVTAVFQRVPDNKGFMIWTDPCVTAEETKSLVWLFLQVRRHLCAHAFSGLEQIRVRKGMEYLSRLHDDKSMLDLSHSLLTRRNLATYLVIPHELQRYLIDVPDEPLAEFVMVSGICHAFSLVANWRIRGVNSHTGPRILRELGEVEAIEDNGPHMQRLLQRLIDKTRELGRPVVVDEYVKDILEYFQNEPYLKSLKCKAPPHEDEIEYFTTKSIALFQPIRWDALSKEPSREAYAIFDDETGGVEGSAMARDLNSESFRIECCADGEEEAGGIDEDPLGSIDTSQRTLHVHVPARDHFIYTNEDLRFAAAVVQRTRYLLHEEPELERRIVKRMRMEEPFRTTVQGYMRVISKNPLVASATDKDSVPAFMPNYPVERDFDILVPDLICRINHARCLLGCYKAYRKMKAKLHRLKLPVPEALRNRYSWLDTALFYFPMSATIRRTKEAEAFLVEAEPKLKPVFEYPFFSMLRLVSPMQEMCLDPERQAEKKKESMAPTFTSAGVAGYQRTDADSAHRKPDTGSTHRGTDTAPGHQGSSTGPTHPSGNTRPPASVSHDAACGVSTVQVEPPPLATPFDIASPDPLIREICRIGIPAEEKSDEVSMQCFRGADFEKKLAKIQERPGAKNIHWNDPPGFADPMKLVMILDMDHAKHVDEQGRLDPAGLMQTLVHLKTNMLGFSRLDSVRAIIETLWGQTVLKKDLVRLFWEFHFGSELSLLTYDDNEQLMRLCLNPLWKGCDISISATVDNIALDRLFIGLCGYVNERLMVQPFLGKAFRMRDEMSEQGDEVPESMTAAIEDLTGRASSDSRQMKLARKAQKTIKLICADSDMLLLSSVESFQKAIHMQPVSELPLP